MASGFERVPASRRSDDLDDTSTTPLLMDGRDKDLEVGGVRAAAVAASAASAAAADNSDSVDMDSGGDGGRGTETAEGGLRQGLDQRHLSMLAIAGAIGTGLFLGLGGAVRTAGPAGALLGYAAVGLVVCAVQSALGETAALFPVTGSFVRHAEVLWDPAWGFAVGWNLVYGNLLAVPAELAAICVLVRFWPALAGVSAAVWVAAFGALTAGVGFARVRVLGEVEFACALAKVALVVGLVVLGLVVDLGGVPGTPRLGFRYWVQPGPFVDHLAGGAWGRCLGVWSGTTGAVFSFAGVESLAMAAAETRRPRQAIPRACQRVFARIALFYVLAVFVVGLLVASDDPRLGDDAATGTAAQSPFVLAAAAAGVPGVASVVNAVVVTSAWSSANQALLSGTRVLYGLARKQQAPRLFLRTTAAGTPYACVALFAAFMLLGFLALSASALTVFWWLVDLTAAGVLVSWITILANHLRLLAALRAQGIPAARLPWHHSWTRYSSAAALVLCLAFLLTGGYEVFVPGHWDAAAFVSAYLDVPLVLAAFLFWKRWRRTSVRALADIPLAAAIAQADRDAEDAAEEDAAAAAAAPKRRRWTGAIRWLWD